MSKRCMSDVLLKLKPECAVCGKPVDEMLLERDFASDNMIFLVKCHGQREEATVDALVLDRDDIVGSAVAFKNTLVTDEQKLKLTAADKYTLEYLERMGVDTDCKGKE